MSTLLAFVAVAALVIVTPGPGHGADDPEHAVRAGAASGIATAVGVSSGQAVWALATSLGLAAVVVASERVFLALKLLGAAYLVLLGVQSLWRAWSGGAAAADDGTSRSARGRASGRGSSRTSATRRWPCSSRACCRSSRPGERRSSTCSALGLLFCAMTRRLARRLRARRRPCLAGPPAARSSAECSTR